MRFKIMTVSQLAEYISSKIDPDNVTANPFIECNFAPVDPGIDDVDEKAANDMLGMPCWYGIKSIDAGFSSSDLILISDYYGGGCASMVSLWNGMNDFGEDAMTDGITECILDTLRHEYRADEETKLLVVEY